MISFLRWSIISPFSLSESMKIILEFSFKIENMLEIRHCDDLETKKHVTCAFSEDIKHFPRMRETSKKSPPKQYV